MRSHVLAFAGLWLGTTLVLSQVRWFQRSSLTDRLAPYGAHPRSHPGPATIRQVIEPIARSIGDAIARALGVDDDLTTRLRRLHSASTPGEFRMAQLGAGLAAMAVAAIASITTDPPMAVVAVLLIGLPGLAVLTIEQRLSSASARWQRRVLLELPVVSEQLAMLLGAGYSLSAALNRLAKRGSGLMATDLSRVTARMRQGMDETEALREWAGVAGVPALDRLVAVLALNREASDLGRLVTDEARSIRLLVHRQQVEVMERRAQQVWIPVTVATLVPGAIFLAIPFIEALSLFAGS